MFTTEIRVGRLYEHRLGTLAADSDLHALRDRGVAVIQKSAESVIVCADYRQVRFVKAELVPQFVDFLRTVSPKIERSAVLLEPGHAIFSMQMSRMIREAGFDQRRAFTDARLAKAWLGERHTAAERGRLSAFLSESLPPT
jgi:hypothetical protein